MRCNAKQQVHESHAFRSGQIEALIWAGIDTMRAIAVQLDMNEATVRWHLQRMTTVDRVEQRTDNWNQVQHRYQLKAA